MLVYLGIDVFIVALGYLLTKKNISFGEKNIDGIKIFYTLSAVLLVFVSSFRGDFATDYKGYEDIYVKFSNYSLRDIINRPLFSNPEAGYLVLQHFVQKIFGNVIYIFIITSIVIVLCNLLELKKQCVLPMLAILLFVEAGIYQGSFNLVRQAFANSIVLLGSEFLYKRKLLKYLAVVIFASLFHTSVIVMIPFYFISTVKINRKNVLFYPMVIWGLLFLQTHIMVFVNQYFWTWYDVTSNQGYSWKNIVMATFLTGSGMVLYYFDKKQASNVSYSIQRKSSLKEIDIRQRVWMNATVLYFVFYLMGLTFSYAQRFSFAFSTYTICFFCLQVTRSRHKKILEFATIIFIILYSVIVKLDMPYYFIWNR